MQSVINTLYQNGNIKVLQIQDMRVKPKLACIFRGNLVVAETGHDLVAIFFNLCNLLNRAILADKNDSRSELGLSASQFKECFDEYFNTIRNFIYFKVGDTDLAEDLAQDAFVKLWENRQKIDRSTLKSYLYTIANNITINRMKRRQLQFKYMAANPIGSENRSPEFELEMKEYEAKLQQVISGMPDGSREVFLMNRLEDLKYREIAERLNISVKAVEKRMSKALTIIREKLNVNI